MPYLRGDEVLSIALYPCRRSRPCTVEDATNREEVLTRNFERSVSTTRGATHAKTRSHIMETIDLQKNRFNVPGSGVPLIFLQQLRSRCPVRDLIWTTVLTLAHLSVAVALQTQLGVLRDYSLTTNLLSEILTMESITIPFIFLLLSAIFGALSAPNSAQSHEVQSQLLTRLTAFDICAGRLLAALWVPIFSLTISCSLWLSAQGVWRFVHVTNNGVGPVLLMFLTQFLAIFSTGALSMLFALTRKPASNWGRGALIGAGWSLFSLSGILLCNAGLRRMDDPVRLINALLLINPATTAASALNHDILRRDWIYERTIAPQYLFSYPVVWQSVLFFGVMAFFALGAASWRLRRAYE